MAKPQIVYRDIRDTKYQLVDTVRQSTGLALEHPAESDSRLLHLGRTGVLTVRAGWLWDGPSGPALDTSTAMRASLVHDALYQLMREGSLPQDCKTRSDELLWLICLEDGMDRKRADRFHAAVQFFGGYFCRPGPSKFPRLKAP